MIVHVELAVVVFEDDVDAIGEGYVMLSRSRRSASEVLDKVGDEVSLVSDEADVGLEEGDGEDPRSHFVPGERRRHLSEDLRGKIQRL